MVVWKCVRASVPQVPYFIWHRRCDVKYVFHTMQRFQERVILGHIGNHHNLQIIGVSLRGWSNHDLLNGGLSADCCADTIARLESMGDTSVACATTSSSDLCA